VCSLAADGTQIGDAFAHTVNDAEKAPEEAEKPLPADYCGSCYGAETREGQCCNSCDDVRDAYASRGWNVGEIASTSEQCARERRNHQQQSQPGEGCRLTGLMMVNKVSLRRRRVGRGARGRCATAARFSCSPAAWPRCPPHLHVSPPTPRLLLQVAGNFHVAMGETHTRGAGHIHQFNPNQIASYNVSHSEWRRPLPGKLRQGSPMMPF
jgi:hypothetical protein